MNQSTSDLQRSWIDSAGLNATILTEFDILVVASPEMVDRDGWTRVRQSVDNGAVLMVFPPAIDGAQVGDKALPRLLLQEAHTPVTTYGAPHPVVGADALIDSGQVVIQAEVAANETPKLRGRRWRALPLQSQRGLAELDQVAVNDPVVPAISRPAGPPESLPAIKGEG